MNSPSSLHLLLRFNANSDLNRPPCLAKLPRVWLPNATQYRRNTRKAKISSMNPTKQMILRGLNTLRIRQIPIFKQRIPPIDPTPPSSALAIGAMNPPERPHRKPKAQAVVKLDERGSRFWNTSFSNFSLYPLSLHLTDVKESLVSPVGRDNCSPVRTLLVVLRTRIP